MNFGVYSRKSKFTGKGESVENQVQLCKEYIERHFGELSQHCIEVFEDEGFSGKNLARPEFQRMLALAHRKKFDYIICYRLDRISRNVSDFSTLIEDFDHNKISFICIKEQFDTSTPMGRAMMYIASVFAQLERETIAERIRDNMVMLARTGRWLGGTTPLGFESAQITKELVDGKEKTSFMLSPIANESKLVRMIYGKFLELKSLTKVETYLLQHGAKTRKDKDFTIVALREILTNPVYCVADEKAFDYFAQAQSDICNERSDFQGAYGIAAYNRTVNEGKQQNKTPVSQWIVTIGKHEGLIQSSDWILVQKILKSNQPKKISNKVQNPIALLSGLLICKNCGSFLRPRVNSNKCRDAQGNQTFAYLCERKKKSKGANCNIQNINGNALDRIVCEEILKYDVDGSAVHSKLQSLQKQVSKGNSAAQVALDSVKMQIADKRRQIDELIAVLGKATGSAGKLYEYTAQKVDVLDTEIAKLQQEAVRLEKEVCDSESLENQAETICDTLKSFARTFHAASVQEKRFFIRSVVQKVEWDGEEIHIFLFGEPQEPRPA